MTFTDGIPNLFQVEQDIWRGGQPAPKGWDWLKSEGITDVVKLNTEAEGSDTIAEQLGLTVHRFPIPWWRQVICRPKQSDLVAAVNLIRRHTFVHCERGEDRTGLVIGCFRLTLGWTPEEAYHEMLAFDFHPVLQGLQGRWNSQRPEDWARR